jgi:hypothetical protein
MPQKYGSMRALLGNGLGCMALAAAGFLMLGSFSWADDLFPGRGGGEIRNDRAVRLIESIPVPVSNSNVTAGALYSFDISWVDQATQTYYLADRSNRSVDIVDAKTDMFLAQLTASPPFAGVSPPAFATATAGPNGVTAGGHCLFVTDAPSRVVSFDTTSFPPTQISDVHTATGDPRRADELAYDPKDGLLLVINNADTPPFGTFISVNKATCALAVGNRLTLDAAHGVDAQAGAEQPVWEPVTGRFYLSIPQIGPTVSHGGVVRIAPNATSVSPGDVIGIDFCSPAGLTVGPQQDLLVGCNTVFDTNGNVWDPLGKVTAAPQDVIINVVSRKIDANVLGVGAGDEVWYNPGDNNYYATGSGSPFRPIDITPAPTPPATTVPQTAQGSTPLGVIDAGDEKVLQLITTFNVPAVTTGDTSTRHPAGTAHSVAANAANNHIFVPIAANNAFPDCLSGCIAVFAHPDEDRPGESAPLP